MLIGEPLNLNECSLKFGLKVIKCGLNFVPNRIASVELSLRSRLAPPLEMTVGAREEERRE
jgi:hypothetical protein